MTPPSGASGWHPDPLGPAIKEALQPDFDLVATPPDGGLAALAGPTSASASAPRPSTPSGTWVLVAAAVLAVAVAAISIALVGDGSGSDPRTPASARAASPGSTASSRPPSAPAGPKPSGSPADPTSSTDPEGMDEADAAAGDAASGRIAGSGPVHQAPGTTSGPTATSAPSAPAASIPIPAPTVPPASTTTAPSVTSTTSTPQGATELMVSRRSDRAEPVPLEGSVLDGLVYVFLEVVAAPTDGSGVSFWFDDPSVVGEPLTVEHVAPYDLAGTAPDGTANAFDAGTLRAGPHTLTAVAGSGRLVTAHFVIFSGLR